MNATHRGFLLENCKLQFYSSHMRALQNVISTDYHSFDVHLLHVYSFLYNALFQYTSGTVYIDSKPCT